MTHPFDNDGMVEFDVWVPSVKPMTHELTIIFDERMLARKYGISCSCGWKGSAATYAEAEEVAKGHQKRMEGK